jgi:hypothetical protein
MALGEFTLRIDGEQLGGDPETTATLKLLIQGQTAIVDEAAHKILFPAKGTDKGLRISLPYTIELPTDIAAASPDLSENLGYYIDVRTDAGGRVEANFAARAADSIVNIDDLTETIVTPVSDQARLRNETQELRDETEAFRDQVVAVGNTNDTIMAGKIRDVTPSQSRQALDEAAATQWQPTLPNIGMSTERFLLRSSDDGDVSSQVTAFLADANIKGRRKLVGRAKCASTVTMPADVIFDGGQGLLEMTSNATLLMNVGARCHIEAIRAQGKTTDYLPSQKSSSQQRSALRLNNAPDVTIDQAVLNGFGESGIYATDSPRLHGGRIISEGVHGKPAGVSEITTWSNGRAVAVGDLLLNDTGVSGHIGVYRYTQAGTTSASGTGPAGENVNDILNDGTAKCIFQWPETFIVDGNFVVPHLDARSRTLTATGQITGCPDWVIEFIQGKNQSMGMTTGHLEKGWQIGMARWEDILGQHGIYHQGGDGLSIENVFGRRVNINVVKSQLTIAAPSDCFGMRLGSIVAYDSGCALFVTQTARDKTDVGTGFDDWLPDHDYLAGTLVSNGGVAYEAQVDGRSGSSGGPAGTTPGLDIVDNTMIWRYAGMALVPIFKGVECGEVVAYDCERLASLNSIQGGRFGLMAGYGITRDALTLQNVKDSALGQVTLTEYGYVGLYYRGGQGGANLRNTVESFKARNPSRTNSTLPGGVAVGLYASDANAQDFTLRNWDLDADNSQMDHGMLFTTAGMAVVPTTKFESVRVRNEQISPIKFWTKPTNTGRWDVDVTAAVENFPDMQAQGLVSPYFTPADNGYIGATGDPANSTTNLTVLTPGVLFLAKARIVSSRKGLGLRYTTGASAVGATSGQCFIGIYEGIDLGALLATTADLSGSGTGQWGAAAGDKSNDFAALLATRPLGSHVYVAFLFNGTTGPTLRGNTTSGKANLGAPSGAPRYGTAGSGLTALPANLPTPITASVLQPFVGIKAN